MLDENNQLVVFQDKKIRRVLYNGEWHFSVVDIISALVDSANPRNYWNMIKAREAEQGIELYTNCVQLKLIAEDGKLRETDCATTKGIFRIIQSIPSKKAEPFKLWLKEILFLFCCTSNAFANACIEDHNQIISKLTFHQHL